MSSLTKQCWVCLENSTTLENICTLDSDNVGIAEKLIYCLPELESNAKQNEILICNICRDKLNMFYDFKRSAIENHKHSINNVSKEKENGTHNATKSSEEPVCVFVKSEIHSDEETENKLINTETYNFNMNDDSSSDEEDPLDNCSEIEESKILPEISPEILVQEIIDKPDKQFHCMICPAYFSNKYSLKKHVNVHTIDKKFTCIYCQKEFSGKSNLVRHQKIHTGTKPFTCTFCLKKFSRKQAMHNHMRLHSDERPYSCTVCKKNFAVSSRLSRHLLLHGEKLYSCDICPKQFPRQYDLNVHLRKHTGEKPFSCEYCPKQFKHRKSMTAHMKMHNQGRRDKFNTHKKVRNKNT